MWLLCLFPRLSGPALFLDARSSRSCERDRGHHGKFRDAENGFNWTRVKFVTNASNGPKPFTFRNCGVANAHSPATSYMAAYFGPSPIATKRRAESQPGQASNWGRCVSSYQALKAAS